MLDKRDNPYTMDAPKKFLMHDECNICLVYTLTALGNKVTNQWFQKAIIMQLHSFPEKRAKGTRTQNEERKTGLGIQSAPKAFHPLLHASTLS